MNTAPHVCDRKGPPAKVIGESGDEPITRTYPTCSVCGVPQVFGDRRIRNAEADVLKQYGRI